MAGNSAQSREGIPMSAADPPHAGPRPISPEQLDRLMTVTSPVRWLALLATLVMLLCLVAWGFYGTIPMSVDGGGVLLRVGGLRPVSSMAAGRVEQVLVHEGDDVQEGRVVARLQPLNQYPTPATVEITAPCGGRVVQVTTRPGAVVQAGDQLLNLGPLVGDLEAVLYLPIDKGKKVRPGQQVQLTVSTVDRQEYGYLCATVREVSAFATTAAQMRQVLGNDDLVKTFLGGSDPYQRAPIEIRVRLERDLTMASGYHWSSEKGPPFSVTPDTVCTAEIVTGTEHPVDLVVPYLLKRLGARPE